MRRFAYDGLDQKGTRIRGVVWARERSDARAILDQRQLTLIDLTAEDEEARSLVGTRLARLAVIRALATQMAAGVSMRRALAATENTLLSPQVQQAVHDVRAMVAEGEALGPSLQRAGLASSVIVSMVRTGESIGDLPRALHMAVQQLEHEDAVAGRLRSALTYPAILAVTASVSLGVIVLVVLPRFADIVREIGAQPPAVALPLLSIARTTRAHLPTVAALTALTTASVVASLTSTRGRRVLLALATRAPLTSGVMRAWSAARTIRELGTLIHAGTPVLRALDVATGSATGTVAATKLRRVGERVGNGDRLSRALVAADVLPPAVVSMVEVGEQTARLGESLITAAEQLDRDVDRMLDTMLVALQPAIVLVFGGVIALVAGAVLQTLYSVRPAL